MAATACGPSAQSPTISMSLSQFSNRRSFLRAGGSSSTMSVRIAIVVLPYRWGDFQWRDPQRKREGHHQASAWPVAESKALVRAVELLQSRPRIAQAYTLLDRRFSFGQAGTVVAHPQAKH